MPATARVQVTAPVEPLAPAEDSVTVVLDDLAVRPAVDPVIGPEIQAARDRLRLSIDQVSERTRIRPHVIEAIEVDDFSPCGGDFYARGHLRTIARVLGVDAGPLVASYDERYAHEPVDPRRVFQSEPGDRHRGRDPQHPRRAQLVGDDRGRDGRGADLVGGPAGHGRRRAGRQGPGAQHERRRLRHRGHAGRPGQVDPHRRGRGSDAEHPRRRRQDRLRRQPGLRADLGPQGGPADPDLHHRRLGALRRGWRQAEAPGRDRRRGQQDRGGAQGRVLRNPGRACPNGRLDRT
ncbi:helix-turn-helix domain-containing protein [Nocardioides sp. W3-2-3]|nr:helix-turn-helix domain-containing protein [Nocardioides convexus]